MLSVGCLSLFLHVAMDEEIVQTAQYNHGAGEPDGDAMQLAFHETFVLAHFDAGVAEHGTPDG